MTYPSGSVLLTTTAPFTAAATAFSPHQDIPTGAVQVASVGSAANGTGTYSATVNWGDGSAVQAATVTIIASTGTVVAPTHTYAHAGTFTVTATVANTDGTTLVTTESVVVPPLAVTHISPSSGPMTGGTKVTVTGSGFTGATKVAFGKTAGKSLTVVNDTTLTVVSPAQAPGVYAIRVTTPAGTSPAVTADKYTCHRPGGHRHLADRRPDEGAPPSPSPAAASPGPPRWPSARRRASPSPWSTTPPSPWRAGRGPGRGRRQGDHPGRHQCRGGRRPVHLRRPGRHHHLPTSGPSKGGTTVTITGSGFTGATKVAFGTTAGKSFTVVDDTTITAIAPAEAPGAVAVKVTTPDGTSATVAADLFTYVGPAVTAISRPAAQPGAPRSPSPAAASPGPPRWPSARWRQVPRGGRRHHHHRQIPAGSSGTVAVKVTTPDGTSAAVAADLFTYS